MKINQILESGIEKKKLSRNFYENLKVEYSELRIKLLDYLKTDELIFYAGALIEAILEESMN